MTEHENQPLLRIVRGSPEPEEVAAVVTLVASLAGAEAPGEAPTPISGWADRGRLVRRPVEHGPGAWRASAAPR